MHLVTSHSFAVDSEIHVGQQVQTTAIIASNVVQQIILQEDVEGCRETDRGCVSGTGCSRSRFVPPCLQILWKQRGYFLFQAMQ